MARIIKTFRLSEAAVNAIENRDKKQYETATEFVEAKLLMSVDSSQELLSRIFKELEELRYRIDEEEREKEIEQMRLCEQRYREMDDTFEF